MAAKTINLESFGESKSNFIQPKLTNTTSMMLRLGVLLAQRMSEQMDKADSSSSGAAQDSLNPKAVVEDKGVYTVEIEGLFYINFVDKGVNGWAKSRGSEYSFKTKGVDPNSSMVDNIMAYMQREKSFAADKYKSKVAVSQKESKRAKITDLSRRKAVSVAYMIKRQGIQGTGFKEKAKQLVLKDLAKQLGEAVVQDIILNIN